MKTTIMFSLCLMLATLSHCKAANDYSYAVAVDALGNAYISGFTRGSLEGPNAGGYDAFLTKFDSSGNELWGRQIGIGIPEPGDFDFNGIVDGEDFLFWQRNPSVGLLADWEAQYGAVAPLSAASTAVPEPSSLLLGALASIGLMLRRKRCRWVAFGVFGSWIETAEVRHRRTLATCDWTCRWGHPQREPRSSHSDW